MTLLFGMAAALLLSQSAAAQSLVWTESLYAHVPPWRDALFDAGQGGNLIDSPSMPDWDANTRSVMLLSEAGEPGIVLAGRAQIEDVSLPIQPAGTPWLAKIARTDGALLRTWHLDDYARGEFAEAVVDSTGDIVAVGTQWFSDRSYGSLVIKVDAATGAVRWRVDGPRVVFRARRRDRRERRRRDHRIARSGGAGRIQVRA
ncbi:MAG TPA: hypothetical protein VGC30_16210 [Dokdonella sp.]